MTRCDADVCTQLGCKEYHDSDANCVFATQMLCHRPPHSLLLAMRVARRPPRACECARSRVWSEEGAVACAPTSLEANR